MAVPSTADNTSATMAVSSHKHFESFLLGIISLTYPGLNINGIFRSLYAGKTSVIV
jgi:hypothetical protein